MNAETQNSKLLGHRSPTEIENNESSKIINSTDLPNASSEDRITDAYPSQIYRLDGVTYTILKWPLLIIACIFLLMNLFVYFLVRQLVLLYEKFIVWKGEPQTIRKKLMSARSYQEWLTSARALDEYFNLMPWKSITASPYYDYKLINSVIQKMKTNSTNWSRLASICLESTCKSNLAGIEHGSLYENCYSGTKTLIENYYATTLTSLHGIAMSPLKYEEKLEFFKRACQLYGRTALCLSGGASFGLFHAGVVKALLDAKLLPTVITGSSAGSFIAAMTCCRTDEELSVLLNSSFHEDIAIVQDGVFKHLYQRVQTGAFFHPSQLKEKVLWATMGNMTFLEAYQRTGRILNISLIRTAPHLPPKLLNYLSTPDVLIWSAIIASCALPGVLHPVQLMYKSPETQDELPFTAAGELWQDGTIRLDIPTNELHRKFNVNFTIVSQVNPHIHVFFFEGKRGTGAPAAHRGGQGWRGGFILSTLEHYLKLNLMKWLKLIRDLNLSPIVYRQDWSAAFLQKFHGNITILPNLSVFHYFYLFKNPLKKDLDAYLISGQRNTWQYFEMIKNRITTEQALFGCYENLKQNFKISKVKEDGQKLDISF
ncbi:hypothetical protein HMI54_003124 [Coelomomyces lativittatus]|nr:hypothetical protein HMI54_003124 [Coelomomyces lativittatus]